MQQQNYNYFINGKKVKNRKEFLDSIMQGEFVTVLDGDTVSAVFIADFFAENKDNNKMVKRQLNNFLKFDLLDKELDCKYKNTIKDLKDLGYNAECISPDCNCKSKVDNTKGHSTRLKANTQMHRLIEDELDRQNIVGNLEGINIPPNYKTFHENKEKINQFFRQPTEQEIIEQFKKSKINLEKEITNKVLDGLLMGQITDKGVKETEGKLDYSEINLGILDLMAQRIAKNKHKYPKGNSLKPMDIKELEQALFRHLKKMIQPIENDPETYEDHLSAILCNSSFILTQLNLHN